MKSLQIHEVWMKIGVETSKKDGQNISKIKTSGYYIVSPQVVHSLHV